jgi:hypothetical protein
MPKTSFRKNSDSPRALTLLIKISPTKQPALRLSRTKNLHFAKATFPGFSAVVQGLDLKGLYKQTVRKKWQKISKKQPSHVSLYLAFQLQYSPVQTATEHFATVLASSKVLEIYALRWAVEVYFKEAKQHLGFLKEQSIHYADWSDSVGHPEFCTDKVVLKSSAIFFSRPVCTDSRSLL